MIFFVVVPIIFGFFANFFIPYHVGSKDVAFPRLNSIGFWIQPAGFLLLFKISFLRPNMLTKSDNIINYKYYFNSLNFDTKNLVNSNDFFINKNYKITNSKVLSSTKNFKNTIFKTNTLLNNWDSE